MFSLNLNPQPLRKLKASKFPERAEVYLCDNCGRDISKHFRPLQSHSWRPMGPERYRRSCGQKYQTGATEWEHLSHGERKRRISQTFAVGFFLSIARSVVGLVLYLGLQSVFRVHQAAGIVALTVSVLPLALMQMTFWPGVMASMWRTRFSSRKVI